MTKLRLFVELGVLFLESLDATFGIDKTLSATREDGVTERGDIAFDYEVGYTIDIACLFTLQSRSGHDLVVRGHVDKNNMVVFGVDSVFHETLLQCSTGAVIYRMNERLASLYVNFPRNMGPCEGLDSLGSGHQFPVT